jgi:hypothetical protein
VPLPSFAPKTCPGYPGCPCTYKNPGTGKTGHIINMCADEVRQPARGVARCSAYCAAKAFIRHCAWRMFSHTCDATTRQDGATLLLLLM